MTDDDGELADFARATRGKRPVHASRLLFGAVRVPTVRALHWYAECTRTARACRMRGDCAAALYWEGKADATYSELPADARW